MMGVEARRDSAGLRQPVAGLGVLCDLLAAPGCGLVELRLSKNQLGDAAVSQLARAVGGGGGGRGLATLALADCRIGNGGAAVVAGRPCGPSPPLHRATHQAKHVARPRRTRRGDGSKAQRRQRFRGGYRRGGGGGGGGPARRDAYGRLDHARCAGPALR